MMTVDCERTILIASEAEMLHWLVTRSSFRNGPIYYPEPGFLYKFTEANGIKPTVRKLEMYTYKYPNYNNNRGYRHLHEDYEHPWYSNRGVSSGKEQRQPTSEQATADEAKLQNKLPKKIRETLDSVNLLPLDKLRFMPTRVQEIYGTPYCNVIGSLPDLRKAGVVQGLRTTAVEGCESKEAWTTMPIGVKVVSGLTGSVVLLRLLKRSVTFTQEPIVETMTQTEKSSVLSLLGGTSQTTIEEDEDGDEEPMELDYTDVPFIDHTGEEVSYEEWLELTKFGCMYCKEAIDPENSEHMKWDEKTGEPICELCAEGYGLDEFVPDENKGAN
jgi:hypothetical protein